MAFLSDIVRNETSDIVHRAADISHIAATYATESEQARSVHPAVITALRDSGLLHLLASTTSSNTGVEDALFSDIVAVLATLSHGDGSVGWLASQFIINNWVATLYSEHATDDVFATTPQALVVSSGSTSGQISTTPDGYVLSGTWKYATGSRWADWASLGVFLDQHGESPARPALILVPRSDWTTDTTWVSDGLAATETQTIIVESSFVPHHRVLEVSDLAHETHIQRPAGDKIPKPPTSPYSFGLIGSAIMSGPMVGLAARAVDIALDSGLTKPLALSEYTHAYNSPSHLTHLGAAHIDAELTYLLSHTLAKDIDQLASTRSAPTAASVLQAKARVSRIGELSSSTFDHILTASGTSAFLNNSHLSRGWRDLEVLRRHAFIQPGAVDLNYGKALLDTTPTEAHTTTIVS